MDITIASLTFTRELLKKIWLKFVKDNEKNKEICDLFTRWCEEADRELEEALQIDMEFIKEQAEYFNNHVCDRKLEDWQIENELIMMFKEAGMEVGKSGK